MIGWELCVEEEIYLWLMVLEADIAAMLVCLVPDLVCRIENVKIQMDVCIFVEDKNLFRQLDDYIWTWL